MTPNPQQYDHEIDAALNTLCAAQPAPGNADEAFAAMNTRLLRDLRTSAGRSNASPWEWLSLPRIAFATTTLAAVWIGTLLLPGLRFHPSQRAAVTTPGAPSVAASSSRMGSAGRQPSVHQSAQSGPTKLSPVGLSGASSISGHGRPALAPSQSTELDPAFLPSSPAPEEPLTHQERLLKTMANSRKPLMLALLEPNEPDLSTLRRPSGPSPLFAGFQPEPQSAPQAAAVATTPDGTSDPVPQP